MRAMLVAIALFGLQTAPSRTQVVLLGTGSPPADPLRTYLQFGVPVALVTDDPGVSRSTMTLEYRKAVEEQGLDYRTLKRMARNSIEYSFVEPPMKTRLKNELAAAFQALERRTQNVERRTTP